MIFIYALGALLVLSSLTGYILSRKALNPTIAEYEDSYRSEVEKERFDDSWFRKLDREDIYIQSDDDLKLHGLWFPSGDSRKTVILSHGYSFTLYGSVKYMKLFRDRDFNILLIDHRGHGLSEGSLCTLGHREKMDHVRWVNWVEDRVGRDTVIGTHGESMGAATALLHGAIDDRVDFIISDCAFQSLRDQLRYRMKTDLGLPPFPLLPLGSLFIKIRGGAFAGDVSPLKAVRQIKVPVLFIHGRKDEYTTPSNSINLHKSKNGPGFIYLAPEAEHGGSYTADPENYRKVVYRFLENAGY